MQCVFTSVSKNILQHSTKNCRFNGTRALYSSCYVNRMSLQKTAPKSTIPRTQDTLNVLFTNRNKRNYDITKTSRCCFSTMDFNEEYEVLCEKVWDDVQRGNDVYIIDVREPMEVEVYGTIPNSVLIPIGDLENALQLDDEDFEKVYVHQKPPDDGEDVIFLCRTGRRSLKATIFARSLGYEQAKSLAGGIVAWQEIEEKKK